MEHNWQIDAIWVSIALISGLLAMRFKQPPLIGFLLAGFFIRYTGKTDGFLSEIIDLLSNLGIMLLLFTIGLKVKIKELLKPVIWATTSLHMLVITILTGGFVFILSYLGLSQFAGITIYTSLIIGFALSFSSTVFVIKVLEDRGEINSFHGTIAIGILVIQDILAVIFLAFSKQELPSIWALGIPIYLWGAKKVLSKLLSDSGHGELLTIFGFFATFVSGALVFSLLGIKPDLGALIIGMLLVDHSKSKELYKKMMEFKDFFLVAFFISIGLTGNITSNAIVISLFIILLLPIKALLYIFFMTRFNVRGRTSFLSTASLSNYSEFGLIIAMVVFKMGLIHQDWLVALALAVAFSFVISSPVNQYVHQIYDYINPFITKYKIKGTLKKIDDAPINFGEAKFLIIGLGTVGFPALDYLTQKCDEKVIGMDYSHETIDRLKTRNRNVVYGDSTDFSFWQNANFEKIEFVVLAMNDFQSNLNTFLEIKKIKERKFKVAVIIGYPDEEKQMKKMGADFIYNYRKFLGIDFAEKIIERKNQF